MISQAGIPGGAETWWILFWATLFPLPISLAVYWIAHRRGDEHTLAWAVGAFVAGLGNSGIGAIAVGLLYLRVRDRSGTNPRSDESNRPNGSRAVGDPERRE